MFERSTETAYVEKLDVKNLSEIKYSKPVKQERI